MVCLWLTVGCVFFVKWKVGWLFGPGLDGCFGQREGWVVCGAWSSSRHVLQVHCPSTELPWLIPTEPCNRSCQD